MARASAAARGNGPELGIHYAVADYCRAKRGGRELFIHVPNEAKRSFALAAILKRMGMRPGVSDLFFPVARGQYHGMWLELKRPGKEPTEKQAQFMADMRGQGYYCTWQDNIDDAIREIDAYFALRIWPSPIPWDTTKLDTVTQALLRAE